MNIRNASLSFGFAFLLFLPLVHADVISPVTAGLVLLIPGLIAIGCVVLIVWLIIRHIRRKNAPK